MIKECTLNHRDNTMVKRIFLNLSGLGLSVPRVKGIFLLGAEYLSPKGLTFEL